MLTRVTVRPGRTVTAVVFCESRRPDRAYFTTSSAELSAARVQGTTRLEGVRDVTVPLRTTGTGGRAGRAVRGQPQAASRRVRNLRSAGSTLSDQRYLVATHLAR